MKRLTDLLILLFCLVFTSPAAWATIFGNVRGVVHDGQHLPIGGASVTLKAQDSDWMQTQESGNDGAFEFTAVPVGNYVVTVTLTGFQPSRQPVEVRSDTSPMLHVEDGALAGPRPEARLVSAESSASGCSGRFGHNEE